MKPGSVIADRVSRSPEEFLRTMAGEELGLSEERLPNPWMSALVATFSTAIGAFLPVRETEGDNGYSWWVPGAVMFAMYAIGIVVAPLVAFILTCSAFSSVSSIQTWPALAAGWDVIFGPALSSVSA